MNKYMLELSYKELLLLDGKVSKDVQRTIDKAKLDESRKFDLQIMNKILDEAEKEGLLKWRHDSIRTCPCCEKTYEYARYKRNSRYHNAGDIISDRPIHHRGMQFNGGQDYMCMDCCEKYKVIETLVHHIIDTDMKIEIQENKYATSKYLKDDIRICYECKEEMKESEMGREPSLMGGGTYPATCPRCEAKAVPLGHSHHVTLRFGHKLNPEFF